MRTTTDTVATSHIGPLDGLRAAAIFLVLLYHLSPGRNPDLGLRSLHWKVADIGWCGVDLFFVLSGFLITTKLIAARGDRHRFRNFYARRTLRIFPLYYAALVVALIAVPLLTRLPFEPLHAQLPYWLYFTNFAWPELRVEQTVSISHFWSLAVEEQFYLLWPAVVFLTRERITRWLCVAVAIAAPLLRLALALNGAEWSATYAWTPSRADGLVLGSLLAFVYVSERFRRRALPLSIAALLVTVAPLAWITWRGKAHWVFTNSVTSEALLVRTLLPTVLALFFAALLVCALEVRPLGRILNGRAQSLIARYSYGMYVVHYMIFPALQKRLPDAAPLTVFLVGTAVSIAIAAVSYECFEKFFLSLKSRFPEGTRAEARS